VKHGELCHWEICSPIVAPKNGSVSSYRAGGNPLEPQVKFESVSPPKGARNIGGLRCRVFIAPPNYISAKRKGTHIINLARTARFLSEACDLVFDAASQGKR
jgi:hypothetical protein